MLLMPNVTGAAASVAELDCNSIKKVIATVVISEPNRNNNALYLMAALVFLVHATIRPATRAANIACQRE
jgi:hypothetical protein